MKKLFALLFALVVVTASAKPVTVTIPFPPGGVTDMAWRTLLPMLEQELKNDNINLVTDYRPGGGGIIAGTHVATATGTQLMFTSSAVIVALAQSSKPPYKTNDFQLLGYFGSLPTMLMVPLTGPKNIKEFTETCKTKTLTFGSSGIGANNQLAGSLIMNAIGCNFIDVPYKGPAQFIPDLVEGRLDFALDFTTGIGMNVLKDNKLRGIIVSSNRRLAEFPNIPTTKEIGINLDNLKNWQVLLINSTADPEDISKISAAVQRVLSKSENTKEFVKIGLDGAGDTVPQTFLQDNYKFYQTTVKNNSK